MTRGFAWAMLTVGATLGRGAAAEAQSMMGEGQSMGGGREARSERLANVTPEQREYLDALRGESEEASAHRVTLRAGMTRYTSGPAAISESLGDVTYRLRSRDMTLRVSG